MINPRNQSIIDKTVDTDEPVIVFRAQDKLTPELLLYYRDLASVNGCDIEFIKVVDEVRADFIAWQALNAERVKTPDL